MSGFPTLRAAFQQFASIHPEHPLAPETTTANATLAPGLIGLSFSSCLRDIARGRVASKDVGMIVAAFPGSKANRRNTVHMSQADLARGLAGATFTPSSDPALAAKKLQRSGKMWRSTAFLTSRGQDHGRMQHSFGCIWIDPRTGDLLRFWNAPDKPQRRPVDWDSISPDESELLAGLHQFYPDNPVFKKAFERG